jgi:dTMP kinase
MSIVKLQPRGVLIAFEGIDGAGKTTQAGMLEEWLRREEISTVRTKEPTDGPWGRLLRGSASTGRLAPDKELDAFIEDRKEHVANLLLPSLAAGAAIIVDRYYFSTAAYQGARGHDPQELIRQNDLLVLVHIEPSAAMVRIRERGDTGNLFEREEDLGRSARIFGSLEMPYLLRVDGTLGRGAVFDQIVGRVALLPQVADALRGRHQADAAKATAEHGAQIAAVEKIARDESLSQDEKVAAVLRVTGAQPPGSN